MGTMINPNDLTVNNKKLGEGSFGAVCTGELYGEVVAIKKVLPQYLEDPEARSAFKDEIRIMSPLKHENCVFLYGACQLDDSVMSLVMEFAGRGSIDDIINLQSQEHNYVRCLEYVCVGTAKGMRYLHRKKIMHRDLKTENVLINSKWCAKVADFGSSLVGRSQRGGGGHGQEVFSAKTKGVGSPLYIAPELLKNSGNYTEKCDVFSFSMLLFSALGLFNEQGLIDTYPKDSVPRWIKYRLEGGRPNVPGEQESPVIVSSYRLLAAIFLPYASNTT